MKGGKLQQSFITALKSKRIGSLVHAVCMLLHKQEEVQEEVRQDIVLQTGKSVLCATSGILDAEKLGFKLPTNISHSNGYFHLSIWISKIYQQNEQ